MIETTQETSTILSLLAGVGAVIGLGKLFASDTKLTMRIVVGRAIVSGGLGAASAVLLGLFPDIPLSVQCGLAAVLASLGTSGIEKMLRASFGYQD